MRAIEDDDLQRLIKKALAFDIISVHGKEYLFSGSIVDRLDAQAKQKVQEYQKIAIRKNN